MVELVRYLILIFCVNHLSDIPEPIERIPLPLDREPIISDILFESVDKGYVVDWNKQPVNDALIEVYYFQNNSYTIGAETEKVYCSDHSMGIIGLPVQKLGESKSNPDGQFEISYQLLDSNNYRDSNFLIVASKTGYGMAFCQRYELDNSIESALLLHQSNSLSGIVRDQDGQPARDITVHAVLMPDNDDYLLLNIPLALMNLPHLQTQTDWNGRFIIEGLPDKWSAEFGVTDKNGAFLPGYSYSKTKLYAPHETGFIKSGIETRVVYQPTLPDTPRFYTGDQNVELNIWRLTTSLAGRIIDPGTGQGVADIRVNFLRLKDEKSSDLSFCAITNSEGYFQRLCLPGLYAINQDISNMKQSDYFFNRQTITVTDNENTYLELNAEKPYETTIKLVCQSPLPNKNPIHYSLVHSETKLTFHLFSNPNTETRLKLPSGSYQFKIDQFMPYQVIPNKDTLLVAENQGNRFLIPLISPQKPVDPVEQKKRSGGWLIHVEDQNGQAVSDAELFLFPGNEYLGLTDPSGNAELPVDQLRAMLPPFRTENSYDSVPTCLLAYYPDKKLAGVSLNKYFLGMSGLEITIKMGLTFNMTGKVLDAESHPIPDATVSLEINPSDIFSSKASGNIIQTTSTDNDGTYSFEFLTRSGKPPFYYSVFAVADQYGGKRERLEFQSKSPYRPTSIPSNIPPQIQKQNPIKQQQKNMIMLDAAEVVMNDIILQKASLSIAGTVYDVAGRLVNGAEISISGPRQAQFLPVVTDKNGKFRFDELSAGTIDIGVNLNGFMTHAHARAGNESIYIIADKPRDPPQLNEVQLGQNALVNISAVDAATNLPVEDIAIYFNSIAMANSNSYISRSTDRNGRTWCVVPVGPLQIRAEKYLAFRMLERPETISIENQNQYDIQIKMESIPRLRATVVDPDNQPVEDARMIFVPEMPFFISQSLTMGSASNNADYEYVSTRSNGKVEFVWDPRLAKTQSYPDLIDIPCHLIVFHEKRKLAATFLMNQSYQDEVLLQLQPALTLQGVARSSKGKPLNKMKVEINLTGDKHGAYSIYCNKTLTDPNGQYRFNTIMPIPEGMYYTLSCYHTRIKLPVDTWPENGIIEQDITLQLQ